MRQEVVWVGAVEYQYGWLFVPFDFGEEFAQFTNHDVVDQIDRWVVEGHSP